MISDILWDNLCIERSEKRCYSIPIKGIKYLSLWEDFLGSFKNISLKIRHNEEIPKNIVVGEKTRRITSLLITTHVTKMVGNASA